MNGEPINHDVRTIVYALLSDIIADKRLSFPWYVPHIRTEAEAETACLDLPLVFSWNEVVVDGRLQSFSCSVNGPHLAWMLEQRLPRSNPDFTWARDTALHLLSTAQNEMLRSLCIEFSAAPSRLTAMASA